jgi:uncharacterized DUF497 family protein
VWDWGLRAGGCRFVYGLHIFGIRREEAEEALTNEPIPIHRQEVAGEDRFVYYGETDSGRLLAVIVTEPGDRLRVVTPYDLDAGQRRDYIGRRLEGE